jgi:hypothetical protein
MPPHEISNPIPSRIDLSDPQLADFWCRHFQCTVEELTDAVKKMGDCTDEVRIFLLNSATSKKSLKFWSGLMDS